MTEESARGTDDSRASRGSILFFLLSEGGKKKHGKPTNQLEKKIKMGEHDEAARDAAGALPPLRLAVLGAGTFALAAWAPLLKYVCLSGEREMDQASPRGR